MAEFFGRHSAAASEIQKISNSRETFKVSLSRDRGHYISTSNMSLDFLSESNDGLLK